MPYDPNEWMGLMDDIGGLASAGTSFYGAYNSYNRGQTADNLSGEQNDRQRYFYDRLQQLNANPSSVLDDPGYQESFDIGRERLDRDLAYRGLTGSGNAMIELEQFGRKFQTDYLTNLRNLYASLSGSGFDPSGAANAASGAYDDAYSQFGDAFSSLGNMLPDDLFGSSDPANTGESGSTGTTPNSGYGGAAGVGGGIAGAIGADLIGGAGVPAGAVSVIGPTGEVVAGGSIAGVEAGAAGAAGAEGAAGGAGGSAGAGSALGTVALIALPAILGMLDLSGREAFGHAATSFAQANNLPMFHGNLSSGRGRGQDIAGVWTRLPDGRYLNLRMHDNILQMDQDQLNAFFAGFQGDILPPGVRLDPF